ncbi:MAG TPA: PQQ-binding-like beta-propeller repeat protein [Gemmataceae bacterium]|nr:PQQ-binding-like beta-propeller repeat protein [Gemmataceae bacterium]
MKNPAALLALLIPGILGASAPVNNTAQNPLEQWPHWRGPLATGAAPHGDPPTTWSEKSNIKWKVAIPGKGSCTPIVWGDHVFVAAAVNTGRTAKAEDIPKVDPKMELKTKTPKTYHQFLLICFDRQTGKERWQRICTERVPHEGYQETHSYAAGSPTTDGKHVWVSFGSRGVYCFDFDGKPQWQRELGFFYSRYSYGEASTPVLYKDNLILNWDNEFESKLIILDAQTGKTRREIKREEQTSWNTPLVVEHKGITQVIVNGTTRARGYDLATGQELWKVGGMTINAIPSAVSADGVAYIMSGFSGSLAVAVPLDARGELTGTKKLLWTHKKGTPYVPSPLLVGGKLYFTQANSNQLTCLDAKTGNPLIDRVRIEGASSFYASPVSAAGRIYMVDRDGMSFVLKQDTKLEILATNRLNDKIDASPVVVGRQLLLRGHKYLYCIEK